MDEKRSSDKSSKLELQQVGYRSHHLVVKTRDFGMEPVASILKKTFIEIQIRSVISHAWAEIEHSLRYKIGVGIPKDLARRFDALAGTLELVDREFSGIERDTFALVQEKSVQYSKNIDSHEDLSTIQLLGALRYARPEMKALGPNNLVLPIEDAFRYAKTLVRCGILTVHDFLVALEDNAVSAAVGRYADLLEADVEPGEVSAIAVIGVVVGLRDGSLYGKVDAFSDPKLREALTLL